MILYSIHKNFAFISLHMKKANDKLLAEILFAEYGYI